MIILIGVYATLLGILIATSFVKKLEQFHLLAKISTSLGYIAIFAISAITASNFSLAISLAPAFIFCLLGDTFISMKNPKIRKKTLIAAVVFFLLGHVVFVLEFATYRPFKPTDFIVPVLGVLLAGCLIKLPQVEVGDMKTPVMIYSFFVSLLLSKAISLAGADIPAIARTLVIGGSILFFISDVTILFVLFHKRKVAPLKVLNLGSYYIGMLMLALSALYF